MNEQVKTLEAFIEKTKKDLGNAQYKLKKIRDLCPHEWGPIKDCSETIPAYTIPADPPGTHGVDWHDACHVPAKKIEKWGRTCRKCGLTEETTDTEQHVTNVPKFR